jgi:hypothetical protein
LYLGKRKSLSKTLLIKHAWDSMIWRNISLVTVALAVFLSSPAAAQDSVEIKDLKEDLALHSSKTFRYIVHQAHAAEHFCAGGKDIVISAEIPRCLGSG